MVLEQTTNNKDYQRLVNKVYQASNFDFVGIALQEPYYPFLIKWRFVAGNQNERFRQITLHRGFGIAGLVFRTGKPFFSNDLAKYSYSNEMYTPIAVAESLWSAVAIPLSSKVGTIGGVLLAGFRSPTIVDSGTVDQLKNFAKQ